MLFDAIAKGAPLEVDGQANLRTMRLLDAIVRSTEAGVSVDL